MRQLNWQYGLNASLCWYEDDLVAVEGVNLVMLVCAISRHDSGERMGVVVREGED